MEKLNEGDVLELVIDYLKTKGYSAAEQALRKEKGLGGGVVASAATTQAGAGKLTST